MSTPTRYERPPPDIQLARDHSVLDQPPKYCCGGLACGPGLWESEKIVPFSTRVFTCARADAGPGAAADGLAFDANLGAWYTDLSSPTLLHQLRAWGGLRPPCTRTVMELNAAIQHAHPFFAFGEGTAFYVAELRSAPFSVHVADDLLDDAYHVHLRCLYRALVKLQERDTTLPPRPIIPGVNFRGARPTTPPAQENRPRFAVMRTTGTNGEPDC